MLRTLAKRKQAAFVGMMTDEAAANDHGVCNAANGEWHGNWLNFMMTSRIDAIKKVLYGGTRQIDRKICFSRACRPDNHHQSAF